MKRKGFTLIELLVVIAIIALLMSILMPALAQVRELAQRVVCGSNLKGIGTAMVVYANEDETGRFPVSGLPGGTWGTETDWMNPDRLAAFQNTQATIAASFWLLVKRDYTTTKQFVCKSDAPTVTCSTTNFNYLDVWDFGDAGPPSSLDPKKYVSYAYHMPYDDGSGVCFPLTAASDPGLAVAADRSPGTGAGLNSISHQGDGQSVMFVDTHVAFEKTPDVGVSGDDIYATDPPGAGAPVHYLDSFLVND